MFVARKVKIAFKMNSETNTKVYVISYGATERINIKENNDDYITKTIGAFGVWQFIVCATAASARVIAFWNMVSIMFLTPSTNFACIQFANNTTVDVQMSTCYDNCVEYEYYEDNFESTLITQFHLICERAWLASFTQTILMFGLLVGVSLFGWISDRFGRRTALLSSSFINVIFMMAAPFAPNYWTFNCIRFFIGLASGGNLIISVVFVMEIVGSQHREMAGCCVILPDGITEASLAIFAYLSPNWNVYMISYSIISLFFLMFIVFLPETPRWLMTNGKIDKVLELMSKAAKRNKLNVANIKDNITTAMNTMKINEKERLKATYFDLFATRELSIKTISSFMVWSLTGICYFGINQYATYLGSNLFISVIALGLIQVPVSPLSMILNKVYGRKPSTIASLVVAGVTMLFLIFTPEGHWACTVLAVIGTSASSTTFAIIYVYCSELFPTPLRAMAYGISSGGAKIGAMLAPFIASIHPQWIASVIFTVIPFVAVIFCFLLPETKGQKLQDTIN